MFTSSLHQKTIRAEMVSGCMFALIALSLDNGGKQSDSSLLKRVQNAYGYAERAASFGIISGRACAPQLIKLAKKLGSEIVQPAEIIDWACETVLRLFWHPLAVSSLRFLEEQCKVNPTQPLLSLGGMGKFKMIKTLQSLSSTFLIGKPELYQDKANVIPWDATEDQLRKHLTDVFTYPHETCVSIDIISQRVRNYVVIESTGDTLLHCATLFCSDLTSEGYIKVLSEFGVDLNTRNVSGDTPLHYACKLPNQHAIKALLRMGADAKALNIRGSSPLHHIGSVEGDLLRLLLDSGGLDMLDQFGKTEGLDAGCLRNGGPPLALSVYRSITGNYKLLLKHPHSRKSIQRAFEVAFEIYNVEAIVAIRLSQGEKFATGVSAQGLPSEGLLAYFLDLIGLPDSRLQALLICGTNFEEVYEMIAKEILALDTNRDAESSPSLQGVIKIRARQIHHAVKSGVAQVRLLRLLFKDLLLRTGLPDFDYNYGSILKSDDKRDILETALIGANLECIDWLCQHGFLEQNRGLLIDTCAVGNCPCWAKVIDTIASSFDVELVQKGCYHALMERRYDIARKYWQILCQRPSEDFSGDTKETIYERVSVSMTVILSHIMGIANRTKTSHDAMIQLFEYWGEYQPDPESLPQPISNTQTRSTILHQDLESRLAEILDKAPFDASLLKETERWSSQMIAYCCRKYDNRIVNMQNIAGQTALHHAAFLWNLEGAKSLIRHGGDIYIKDNNGRTAADYAVMMERFYFTSKTLERGIESIYQSIRQYQELLRLCGYNDERSELEVFQNCLDKMIPLLKSSPGAFFHSPLLSS
ncbi:hypothetical protein TWF694_003770 [Orbilia ellipsospora]|uniref:Ankyrin repeat protein n=1 Tax=Orbilia ellipsospora TaxID=2528407 RepID=A0AAV9WZ81_9PEZI